MDELLLFSLLGGIIALVFAGYLAMTISRQPTGTPRMKEIATAIHEGAMAFLNQEYRILAIFVVAVAAILAVFIGIENALVFLTGAIFSALAGNIGMRIATMANVRTANGVNTSLNKGLRIAFSSGAVMGFTVVGLGLAGVTIMYFIFGDADLLFSFGFGASSIALFARVGGGIYTKAADVGADLVGKVEQKIPEDDPRNPATIADNVGDNVGDVAGMGADLFESYVDSIIAAMALSVVAVALGLGGNGTEMEYLLLPLVIAGIGIIASLIGTFFVQTGEGANVYSAMRYGLFSSAIVMTILAFFAIRFIIGSYEIFYATVVGLVAGLIIGLATEYYTSEKSAPTRKIAEASQTGAATNIIQGLSTSMMSTIIPVITVAAAIMLSFEFAGIYGIAMAAVGMLSILGMSLATDCYGPVADNAAGIAEMAGLGKEARERAEGLDAVGNTTAAMGKGFAIASAGLTALALIYSYTEVVKANGVSMGVISLTEPSVVAGILIGAMLPFAFSAMTLGAVGRAAHKMVEEVRRQFSEKPGILEGTEKPDYARCVSISTQGAIREMVIPTLIAIAAPVTIGLILGPEALGGMLMAATAAGFLLAVMLANAGGAWDNAKKYVEEGNLGGKGSEVHAVTVIGDTVGDPCKDTSGPSLNILIKLMSIVAIVFIPLML